MKLLLLTFNPGLIKQSPYNSPRPHRASRASTTVLTQGSSGRTFTNASNTASSGKASTTASKQGLIRQSSYNCVSSGRAPSLSSGRASTTASNQALRGPTPRLYRTEHLQLCRTRPPQPLNPCGFIKRSSYIQALLDNMMMISIKH